MKEAGRCYYQFFCHEKEGDCIAILENEKDASYRCSVNDKTASDVYSMVIETCNNIAPNCRTHQCTSNNQCFSKKCEKNTCVTNKDNPIIECGSYHSTRKSEIRCKRALNEYCDDNKDCFSGHCNDGICLEQGDSYSYLLLAGTCQIVLYTSFFVFCCYSKGIFKSFRIRRRIR